MGEELIREAQTKEGVLWNTEVPLAEMEVEERPVMAISVEEGEKESDGRGVSLEANTVEEEKLFGGTTGYPTTRRPADFRRELTTEPWDVVSEWFN